MLKRVITFGLLVVLTVSCVSCGKPKAEDTKQEKEQAFTQQQQDEYNRLYIEKYDELMAKIEVTDDEIDKYLNDPNYKKPIKAVDVDTETNRSTYFITEDDIQPKIGDTFMSGTVSAIRDVDDNERKQLASDYLISKKYDEQIREMVKDVK